MLLCPRFRRFSPLVMSLFLAGCASGQIDPPDGILVDLAPPHEAGPDGLVDLAPVDGSRADSPRPEIGPGPPDLGPPDEAPPDLPSKPDSGPLLPTAPFTLSFETSGGGLTGTRDWEWGKIAFVAGPNCDSTPKPPTGGHSGTGMWGTRLNDCYSPLGNADYSCTNSDTTDDSTLTLVFQIPKTFKTASLVYWEWADFFLSYDWSEIYVNGQIVRQQCSGTTTASWVKRVTNLDALVGQKVTVEFHFMATTVVQYAGWYIDDISVTETLPP